MNNMQKNFKAKRTLKCGHFADGVVPTYADQAAQMEAEQIAAAKARALPVQKPGLMARIFGGSPAPAPAPAVVVAPAPVAPTIVENLANRRSTLREAANYADGKVPTHVGPGVVNGPGGPREDKVPAMLSDEEAVLPAKTVQAMGGPDAVEHLIQVTTGKSPARTLSAGKYADGFTYQPDADGIMGRMRGAASSALDSAKGMFTRAEPGVTPPPAANTGTMYQGATDLGTGNRAGSGVGQMSVGKAAGQAVDAVKNSSLARGALKWGGRLATGAGALQAAGNVAAVANDPDSSWLDVVGQTAGEVGKAATAGIGGALGGWGGAAGAGAGANYLLDKTGADVSRYARLPSQAELDKPISEEDIRKATVGPNGQIDEERYQRGLTARTLPSQPASGKPAEATTAAASDAPAKRTLNDALVDAIDRGANTGTPNVDVHGMMRKYGHGYRQVLASTLDQPNRDLTARGQTLQAGVTSRGQDLNYAATTNNNRAAMYMKNLEAQQEQNNKFLDSQFGPAWDKDGKTNDARQRIDKQLQATMAKFGVQHPGQMNNDAMNHFVTTARMVDRASPGVIERGIGRITGKPPTEYDSPYDALEGLKPAKDGSWTLNGVPFNTYSSTLTGSGMGLTGPSADGNAKRIMDAAAKRTIKNDGAH